MFDKRIRLFDLADCFHNKKRKSSSSAGMISFDGRLEAFLIPNVDEVVGEIVKGSYSLDRVKQIIFNGKIMYVRE